MKMEKSNTHDENFDGVMDKLKVAEPAIFCNSGHKIVKVCSNPRCERALQCGEPSCKECGVNVHPMCPSYPLAGITQVLNNCTKKYKEFAAKISDVDDELIKAIYESKKELTAEFHLTGFSSQIQNLVEMIYSNQTQKSVSGLEGKWLCQNLQRIDSSTDHKSVELTKQYQDRIGRIIGEVTRFKKDLIKEYRRQLQSDENYKYKLRSEEVYHNNSSKHQEHYKEDKSYIKSKKKWKDFKLHQDLIQALYEDNKTTPARVQQETLEITENPDRKKINLLISTPNGSGKTMAYMIPILNAIKPGVAIAQDKQFKGKLMKNEIFKPQGIIIVQTDMKEDQLQRILGSYRQYGETKKSDKLNFKIGRMDKEAHECGDIIVAMPKSVINRYERGNLKFDNCKFIAIAQADYIFEQNQETLAQILRIGQANNPSIITCCARIKKYFLSFYEEHSKDVIKLNIHKQLGDENRKHFYKVIQSPRETNIYIISTIFKELYQKKDTQPQIIIFFNSIDEIKEFHQYFTARATDFCNDEAEYLKCLTVGIIAGKKYEDGKKVEMPIRQIYEIRNKFMNNETNILLATNIFTRGVDIRNVCFVINASAPKYSEKENDIDLDIYLHRAGRVGRHNDHGLVLTFVQKDTLTRLVDGLKKIHKIEIEEMKDPVKLAEEVVACIHFNTE